MIDELLPYYNRELTYVRRLGAEFAAAHPKIAGRLRLSADAIEDPMVGRLMEAFAFLTARIRHKLDDDFPELSEALLGALYPHYLAPIPSLAIVRLAPVADLTGSYTVAAGSELDSEPVGGEPCRFRTCYPATLWPVRLTGARLTGRPLVAPPHPRAGRAVASLRLRVECLAGDMTLQQLGVDRLRLFLRAPPQQVYPLHELMLNNTVAVALADSPTDPNPVVLGPEAVRPVGFEADEGVLPYPARSHVGYRLLTEYFAFPEKFLFIEIDGLQALAAKGTSPAIEIFLYLDRTVADLERAVGPDMFALGCTPVVNLFRQKAEPVELSHAVPEYRVVPDARRPAATEVHSILGARATGPDGSSVTFHPFYSAAHARGAGAGDEDDADAAPRAYWYASRRPAERQDDATDVYLSLVDLDFDPAAPARHTLSVDLLCLNRDLPARLPYGGGHPRLTFVEGTAAVESIHCVTAPTATLRVQTGHGLRWRLVSHLILNHLSVTDPEHGAEALREILMLYDFRDSAETRAVIQGVLAVDSRRAAARAPSRDQGAFCRGLDVDILFDEQRFSGNGLFLLAMVLERFLGLYCSINAFTRLSARVKGRPGVLRRWPPRAGDQVLL
ncbi:type VI secretion system baseplate subunit TssF [Roseospira visakhapatnamensis]|uniref:Type VI secretion system protein ImpG n=1 Tax=Roseospira visakhapatnamensis TaxID=390880 RepID=A0A7W6RF04_9PROT|nr:type VI secretion system baseplate subunit TssF [Roseospira visakhapatnamensis]MBB4267339.1 type VI secretion system protein ImpG [Roseospira visakhapatnamensis]